MKIFISVILMLSILMTSLTGCTGSTDTSNTGEVEKLTYYADSFDYFTDTIKRFNRYCDSHDIPEEYKIEIVEFEHEEFRTKLGTEIMSGKGPDIMALSQCLPFEKLIENGAFLDLDPILENDTAEDKIDLSEFNEKAMNAGVFEGKRLILPLGYEANLLFARKESAEKFSLPVKSGDIITFQNMDKAFGNFFENPQSYCLAVGQVMSYIYNLVYESVDFKNKETHFDTENFRKALRNLKEIQKDIERMESLSEEYGDEAYYMLMENSILTMSYGGGSPYDLVHHDSSEIILSGITSFDGEYTANITEGIALNKNTENPEKALPFIKYLLGERVQGDGVSDSYSYSMDFYSIPVSKIALEKNYKAAAESANEVYELEDGSKIPAFDMNCDLMKTGLEIINNIDRFCLYKNPAYSYFTMEVTNDIISEYLEGELSEDEFIENLAVAVELYLKE